MNDFAAINEDPTAGPVTGLLLREGTLVDATLITAPPSTKNQEQKRDTEMHRTRKGQQWYFAMKAHIGADRDRQAGRGETGGDGGPGVSH